MSPTLELCLCRLVIGSEITAITANVDMLLLCTQNSAVVKNEVATELLKCET